MEKFLSIFFLIRSWNSLKKTIRTDNFIKSEVVPFSTSLKLDKIGCVVSVGDGIARVCGKMVNLPTICLVLL